MQHVLTPYAVPVPPYAWWEGAFSDQELDWLQEQARNSEQKAVIGAHQEGEELSKIRRSQVSWIRPNQENIWLFDRLAHVASCLNAEHYRLDLTCFGEPFQLTHYDHSEQGMYGWHQDYNGKVSPSRKLSLVVQLTDPNQYEGGNLQVMTDSNPITVRKQRGLIAAFPAYVLHQVTPVVKGTRQSLVAWVSGPSFR